MLILTTSGIIAELGHWSTGNGLLALPRCGPLWSQEGIWAGPIRRRWPYVCPSALKFHLSVPSCELRDSFLSLLTSLCSLESHILRLLPGNTWRGPAGFQAPWECGIKCGRLWRMWGERQRLGAWGTGETKFTSFTAFLQGHSWDGVGCPLHRTEPTVQGASDQRGSEGAGGWGCVSGLLSA